MANDFTAGQIPASSGNAAWYEAQLNNYWKQQYQGEMKSPYAYDPSKGVTYSNGRWIQSVRPQKPTVGGISWIGQNSGRPSGLGLGGFQYSGMGGANPVSVGMGGMNRQYTGMGAMGGSFGPRKPGVVSAEAQDVANKLGISLDPYTNYSTPEEVFALKKLTPEQVGITNYKKPDTAVDTDVEYAFDPRLYDWNPQTGEAIGMKPQMFGGSLSGIKMAGMGDDVFKTGSSLRGFADGGYVNSGMQDLLERYPDENTVQQLPEQPIAAAPNFAPITQGQVEPSGGGYVPATAAQANPQLAAINPDLYALMQQYTTGPDYSAELKRVGEERRTAEAGFNKALESAMSGADQGPSKAELYFRLAAAFGTPSKTGAFAEGLGQAAGAAAEYKKEERTAATAKRKLATEIALKKQELLLEGVKDREKTLLALQSDNAKDRREAIKGIIKEYIDSGKPQSEAGKIAKDKGFKVGTPEYQEEVDKQAKVLLENKLATIQATLGGLQIAGAKLALDVKKEERAASELDPTELKLLTENKQAIKSTQSALDLMEETATLADKAFTKSTADQAEYKRLKTTDPQHPRVVATEQLEQILTTSGLAGLRSSFGGNPTEGERQVQLLTQGLGATSAASRKQIINRVKNGLVKNKAFYGESNADLLSGSYKKKPVTKE